VFKESNNGRDSIFSLDNSSVVKLFNKNSGLNPKGSKSPYFLDSDTFKALSALYF